MIDYALLKHAIDNAFANNGVIFDKEHIFKHFDNIKKVTTIYLCEKHLLTIIHTKMLVEKWPLKIVEIC